MSALMPPEIHEIAEQATKDAHARAMSKKDQKKLRRACAAQPGSSARAFSSEEGGPLESVSAEQTQA